MRPVGFSTGALARGDFRSGLQLLRAHGIDVVEISALRVNELEPLAAALPTLDLSDFSFVSVHAPSRFPREMEPWVLRQLGTIVQQNHPVVVHPDIIHTPAAWADFGQQVLIENMDKRKPIGRNVRELQGFFNALPEARFCFDIGHARQVDPSMTEASLLLHAFGDRLAEVHISEVNTASRHDPISLNAVEAFRWVAPYIPEDIAIVIESLIDQGQSDIRTEVDRARHALTEGRAVAI